MAFRSPDIDSYDPQYPRHPLLGKFKRDWSTRPLTEEARAQQAYTYETMPRLEEMKGQFVDKALKALEKAVAEHGTWNAESESKLIEAATDFLYLIRMTTFGYGINSIMIELGGEERIFAVSPPNIQAKVEKVDYSNLPKILGDIDLDRVVAQMMTPEEAGEDLITETVSLDQLKADYR